MARRRRDADGLSDSLPPFARRTQLDGPSGNVDRLQPYDEEPNDLRFADLQPTGVPRVPPDRAR